MGGGEGHTNTKTCQSKYGKKYGRTYILYGQLALLYNGMKTHSMQVTEHYIKILKKKNTYILATKTSTHAQRPQTHTSDNKIQTLTDRPHIP